MKAVAQSSTKACRTCSAVLSKLVGVDAKRDTGAEGDEDSGTRKDEEGVDVGVEGD